MSFTIAFYVHHHGSGHLMRCLQIASALKNFKIILIGSALKGVDVSPNIELLHLPIDTASDNENEDLSIQTPDAYHYAPTGLKGIRDRTALMTEVFKREFPLLLVVDVSVEISLLARLCSIPTIVMTQHGLRTDLPHLLAYQSAELLLAPFGSELYRGEKDWAYDKTFFSGGFSRFGPPHTTTGIKGCIGILIGDGGSSINHLLIEKIAVSVPGYTFHILGKTVKNSSLQNVTWHGKIDHPQSILEKCDIIIGNTGHNTVMEVASLNKRFIGIPEDRPFKEQEEKAASIAERSGIEIIGVEHLCLTDWKVLLAKLAAEEPDWLGVIDRNALSHIAQAIIDTGNKLFIS